MTIAEQLETTQQTGIAPVELRVDDLHKRFARRQVPPQGQEERPAVGGVSFVVEAGLLFTLLGPSGCGKTTTLRSIAGLELPDSGVISVGGDKLYDRENNINVPSERRGLGMVFQSYAIWPHMTVQQNAAFPFRVGRRRERPSRAVAKRRVDEVLELVGLGETGKRQATDLSGGQQQRLALARALVMRPSVLLLDEPLSNLDAKLRESMRTELKRTQAESGVTSIYVTHDQSEALAMSDVVAVMNEGRIEQIGKPDDIYLRPQSRFVAQFIGSTNLIEGSLATTDVAASVIDTPAGPVVTSDACTDSSGRALLSIRPEDILVSATDGAMPTTNRWDGVVRRRSFLGDSVTYRIQAGWIAWECKGTATNSFEVGDEVHISVAPKRVRIVPDTTPATRHPSHAAQAKEEQGR